MPRSNSNRAKGKHKAGRKQYTGNKFLLTSAEALVIQGQIAELTQYVRTLYLGTHMRLVKLEPPVEQPIDADGNPVAVPDNVQEPVPTTE